jgi:hypothetical protein
MLPPWKASAYAPGCVAIGDSGDGEVILVQAGHGDSRLFVVGIRARTCDIIYEVIALA